MCVEEISALETGNDWGISVDEQEDSIAELNGHKRKITVLHEKNQLAAAIYPQALHAHSSNHRSITQSSIRAVKINPMKTDGSVKAELEITWGGKEGPKWDGKITAEGHDNHGNSAKAEIRRDCDGETRAKISAEHKKERE